MEPVEFGDANTMYGSVNEEVKDMYGLTIDNEIITCWKMGWRCRLRILLTGRIWHSMINFKHPPMPIYITTKKKELYVVTFEEAWDKQGWKGFKTRVKWWWRRIYARRFRKDRLVKLVLHDAPIFPGAVVSFPNGNLAISIGKNYYELLIPKQYEQKQ